MSPLTQIAAIVWLVMVGLILVAGFCVCAYDAIKDNEIKQLTPATQLLSYLFTVAIVVGTGVAVGVLR